MIEKMKSVPCGLVVAILFSYMALAKDEDWRTFNALNSGLAGNNVAAIGMDTDGETIWFGSGEDTLFIGEPGSRGVSKYNKSTDKWEVFTKSNGLAHNSVLSIDIDDHFVWFGTRDGLSRYDKTNCTWKNYNPTNSELTDKSIRQIKIDLDGVWSISAQGKVWRYLNKTDQWTPFDVVQGYSVQSLIMDGNDIWFATDKGACKYNRSTSQWEIVNTANGLIDNGVTCLDADEKYLWFGTVKGVSRLDKSNKTWMHYTADNSDLVDNEIMAIQTDKNYVWFVSKNRGVSRLEKVRGIWSSFNPDNSGISENTIQAIAIDADFAWFGTNRRGVSRYEKNREVMHIFNTKNGLVNNNVLSIGVDTSQVWIGTQDGISVYDKIRPTFKTYNTQNSGITDNVILCIAVENEFIWIGTEGGGLCRYKKKSGDWDVFNTFNSGISDDVIQCIKIYGDEVWLGTKGQGLNRYTKSTGRWKTFKADLSPIPAETGNALPSNDIRAIAIDQDNVWVGFLHPASFIEEAVLSRYNKKNGTWHHYKNSLFGGGFSGNNIQSLEVDGDFLWMGFFEPWTGAMDRFHKTDGRLKTYTYDDGLADRNIWAIGIDSRFNWFGTGSGVNRYDKANDNLIILNSSNGLPNNWIRSIGIDDHCVWLGTLGGGVCLILDEYAPKIVHETLIQDQPVEQAISISARIEENVLVTDAWLFYKTKNKAVFDSIKMTNKLADYWFAEIPSYDVTMAGIDYFIKADDGYNIGYHPWRYPFSPSHSIKIYDNNPPLVQIKISPPKNKNYIFNNGKISVNGTLDGTYSVPSITKLSFNHYNSTANLIRTIDIPVETISLLGENTIRTINDSLHVGVLKASTLYIELELTVHESDSVKDQTFHSNRLLVLQDEEPPLCRISEPKEGTEVGSTVSIVGTVYDLHFSDYQIKFGIGKSPHVWNTLPIPHPTSTLLDTVLGNWYTIGLPDTLYTLVLIASDQANHTATDSVHVKVKKLPVLAARGGQISSPDGKVSLNLSPNALEMDTPVFINSLNTMPPMTDPGISLIGIGYQFLPIDLNLKKSATVVFFYSKEDIQGTTHENDLALFYWDESSRKWIRVGGTLDTDRKTIKTVISRFGTYAVMEDPSGPAGTFSISNVDCQPRIFSPQGGGHDTKTSISFDLGKQADMCIKIYNGAGRLIRVLKENESMSQGNNVVDWDGKNKQGQFCLSGLYIVTIQAENKLVSKTVVVLNKY